MLRTAFFALKRDAAPGVDGLTWEAYEADLDPRSRICTHGFIEEHIGRSPHGGRFIPKPDGLSARSRSPPSKTRSSRGRLRQC